MRLRACRKAPVEEALVTLHNGGAGLFDREAKVKPRSGPVREATREEGGLY